ncbi:isoprenyl transferase [Vibrio sp. JC009]|uniref:isoprenyl transferase n=1 Tax=Vibrio sp. JC009 TaxID=2912314 RepID=UPI0023B040E6|nr:isoprenyl transferase [Vibrio sp. JC009]WED21180.1 isoprenyl transferase [Vibrio sp. JC009]
MSEQQLSSEDLPKHIAVIMDGNGRWAKSKGKPRVFGHRAGAKAVRKTISGAAKLGVKAITLFAFSSENWKRPAEEVNLLMDLFITALSKEVGTLHKNNLQLRVIGDKSRFSERLQKKIQEAEQLTASNTGMVVNVAANYGGKWDITEATRSIARKVKQNEIDLDDISEGLIGDYLTMSDLPEVDLLIRTSGECRISNFMLWQLAYAEMYFTQEFWPDFDEQSLSEAVSWFVNRERRFGCTGEQVKALMDI